MPRPTEYDRQEILNQVMMLFWQRGYAGTTLRDVLSETGFNRHSLYKEFGDMDGLFQAAIENYFQMSAPLWEMLEGENAGLDSIRRIFEKRRSNDSKGLGCLASNTITGGNGGCHQDAVELANRYFRRVNDGIRNCIRNAQKSGEIDPKKDDKALASFVLTILHGLGPMGKMGTPTSTLKKVAEVTINALCK